MLLVNALYRLPRLIDTNAKSTIFRDYKKLLVISRCLEVEKPEIVEKFKAEGYAVLTVCPEAEHINMLGFKLAGILARCRFEEISALTVDGSMHCTQVHWLLEEVFKIAKLNATRKHYIVHEDRVVEVSPEIVKKARFLAKLAKTMQSTKHRE